MARLPLTAEQTTATRFVMNFENVGLSDEQFLRLCRDNRELRLELTARKELIIMAPATPKTSSRNNLISHRLTTWAEKDGSGIVFESSAIFTLPNGAKRSPDASWMRRDRWDALCEEEQDSITDICPDFVIELRSKSDVLADSKEKMSEYVANGAQLGWLIDPYDKCVHIYRQGQDPEHVDSPASLSGEPILPGFVLDLAGIL